MHILVLNTGKGDIYFGPATIEDIRAKLKLEGYEQDESRLPQEVYDKPYSMGRIKATLVPYGNLEDFPRGIRY